MRLTGFRIYNFKSIKDTGWIKLSPEDNIAILAGQNESGKSAILQALKFFEEGPGDDFEDYYRRLGTHPRVECKYVLDKDDLDLLENESQKTDLRKYAEEEGFTLVRGRTDKDDFSMIKYVNPDRLEAIVKVKVEPQEESAYDPNDFNIHKFLLNRHPNFILYDSFHDNILPSKITQAQLGSNQAVTDFESVFDTDFDTLLREPSDALRSKIISALNEKASDNLNTYWRQKIDDEKSTYNFKIEAHPQTAQPTESYINFFVDQGDGFPLHIGQKSQGFQWFSSFNLRLRAHEATAENLSEFILLIDEPGQGLHEQAQKDVKEVLEEIARNGVQIIFSTHQAQLLGGQNIDFSRLRLVARNSNEGTKIKNISQLSSDKGAKDALSPIRTALGMVSIDSSTLAKGESIIVEGVTDYYYLQAFILLYSLKGTTFIPCVGVSQVPNVFSILYGWGVGAKIIVDDDSPGKASFNKIKRSFFSNSTDKEIAKILHINAGCGGIEDTFSKQDFAIIAGSYLDSGRLSSAPTNSQAANGSKEIIARSFFDKVKAKKLKLSSLDGETKDKADRLIDFIKIR